MARHPNTWPAVRLELALPSTFMGPWRWSNLAEGLVKWFGSQECGEMKKDSRRQCCDLLVVRGSLGSLMANCELVDIFWRRLQLGTSSIQHQP